MFHFKWITVLAVAFALGLAGQAHAQVQKSGKATFRWSRHLDIDVVRFHGNQFIFGGSLTALQINEADQGFGHNMGISCAFGGNIPDLAKGLFNPLMEGCVARDKDGDAYFTEAICEMSAWGEWCMGKIVGGTGKFAGMTGTTRARLLPGSTNHFRRSCVEAPKVEDCKPYFNSAFDVPAGVTYHLSGEETEVVEIEWRIP
jgi:hypothetical protein